MSEVVDSIAAVIFLVFLAIIVGSIATWIGLEPPRPKPCPVECKGK